MNEADGGRLFLRATQVVCECRQRIVECRSRRDESGEAHWREKLYVAFEVFKALREAGEGRAERQNKTGGAGGPLPINMFLSQSFDVDVRDKITETAELVARENGIRVNVGHETPLAGPAHQMFIETIRRRIQCCDIFLCVITQKDEIGGGDGEVASGSKRRVGNWFSFETGMAFAFNKPFKVLCHKDTMEEAKRFLGWTELESFSGEVGEEGFNTAVRQTVIKLQNRLFEQVCGGER